MKILKIFLIIILLLNCLFLLTGCDTKNQNELLQEKINSELESIDKLILSIVEKYLRGEYYENDSINWLSIQNDFENISNNSSIIILDLSSYNISHDKILEYENRVNSVNLSIQEENQMLFIENLKNLYNLIPNYLKDIYSENHYLFLSKLYKSYLLESLYSCLNDDFENGLNYIEEAQKIYDKLISNTEYLNENSYKANRVFIAIQEMKICIQNSQKENTILKYLATN